MPKYKGEHLYVDRGLYSHHGIGVGDGRVIHYSGLADGLDSGPVCQVDLNTFSGGSAIQIKSHPNRVYSREKAIERAISRLGENTYNISENNCEHFVEWCIEGVHMSVQVDKAIQKGNSTSTGIAAIGVGGSVMTGTAIVAAAPVAVAAAVGYGAYKVWKWLTD